MMSKSRYSTESLTTHFHIQVPFLDVLSTMVNVSEDYFKYASPFFVPPVCSLFHAGASNRGRARQLGPARARCPRAALLSRGRPGTPVVNRRRRLGGTAFTDGTAWAAARNNHVAPTAS